MEKKSSHFHTLHIRDEELYPDPSCPICGGPKEDPQHIFWECYPNIERRNRLLVTLDKYLPGLSSFISSEMEGDNRKANVNWFAGWPRTSLENIYREVK